MAHVFLEWGIPQWLMLVMWSPTLGSAALGNQMDIVKMVSYTISASALAPLVLHAWGSLLLWCGDLQTTLQVKKQGAQISFQYSCSKKKA